MCIFGLFKKQKTPTDASPAIPSWEEAVRLMQGRQLGFVDEVVRVIPSRDSARRFVLLKSGKGFYKFRYEVLVPYDDESESFGTYEHPAVYWMDPGSVPVSLYADEETALRELETNPEYIDHFA